MVELNANLLKIVKSVGAKPEGKFYATKAEMKDAALAGLVEGNPNAKNPRNAKQIAWRLTAAGKAALPGKADKTTAPTPTTPAKPSAFVIADVELPTVSRPSTGSKYPFDQLDNGKSFFVPEGGDVADPTKTFGSVISNANKKFRTPNDFRKFTSRTMVLDETSAKAYGHPVGTRGVGVFRLSAEDEAAAKAKAFPRAK